MKRRHNKLPLRLQVNEASADEAFVCWRGKAVVQGWLRSPGHRANILHEQFRLVGVAAVKRKGRWWAAQVFGTKA